MAADGGVDRRNLDGGRSPGLVGDPDKLTW